MLMPRMARVVCPGLPHHITQRGVRRFNVFLDEADHLRYRELLGHYALQFGLGITAYCHMTNHVHIVGIPEREDSIAIRTRTYTGRPCGGHAFVRQVEAIVGRRLAPAKSGPKPRPQSDGEPMLWIEDEIRQ